MRASSRRGWFTGGKGEGEPIPDLFYETPVYPSHFYVFTYAREEKNRCGSCIMKFINVSGSALAVRPPHWITVGPPRVYTGIPKLARGE